MRAGIECEIHLVALMGRSLKSSLGQLGLATRREAREIWLSRQSVSLHTGSWLLRHPSGLFTNIRTWSARQLEDRRHKLWGFRRDYHSKNLADTLTTDRLGLYFAMVNTNYSCSIAVKYDVL